MRFPILLTPRPESYAESDRPGQKPRLVGAKGKTSANPRSRNSTSSSKLTSLEPLRRLDLLVVDLVLCNHDKEV